MHFTKAWRDLLHPGDATDFFQRVAMPPFEPDAEGYSRANALWLAELSRLVYRHDVKEGTPTPQPSLDTFLATANFSKRYFFLDKPTDTQAMLGVTLHRLRTLLGIQDAIILQDNKLALNPALCWVDAWESERLLGKLDTLLKTQQPCAQTLAAYTSEFFGLCKGAFLNGDTGNAVVAARERLQDKFLRTLDTIGLYWEQNGDWAQAKAFYQKGLELNPMIESLYQRLMICHREMGQRAEALIVYRRCQDALSAHLNIPPSRHTDAIRRTLIAD